MRSTLATALSGTLLFSALLTACEQRPADPALPTVDVAWRTIQPLQLELSATSVWASALDDIYVGRPSFELFGDVGLGAQPRIFHFNGASWQQLPLPIDDENGQTSIWGSGPGDVYVAVERLYHFDGANWHPAPVDARWVGGTSQSNVFAMSPQRVFHFDGAEWDTLLTREQGFIRSASAAPDGALWIAANDSFLVWDGSTWAPIPWLDRYPPRDIVAFSAGDAIVWLSSPYNNSTRLYRWNGTQWQLEETVPGVFTAVWRDGPSGMYAVGERGLVTHFDGVDWTALPRSTGFDLRAVTATTTGQVVAVGESGKVVAFDGVEWQTLREGNIPLAYAVWAESSERLLVSYPPLVFELDAGRWFETVLPSESGVHAFGGRSLDDAYASLYDASVLHYDGQSWTVSADSLIGPQYAMWTSPSGPIYSAGDRSVYRFDGNWELLLEGDFELGSITGDDDGQIVVTGEPWADETPVVKLFDGSAWRNLPAPLDYIESAWIGPDTDVYLAGARGLYRWDGARFKRLTPAQSGFHYVVGTAGRVIAIGSEATAVFDGALVNVVKMGNPDPVTMALDGMLVGAYREGLAVWRP